MDKNMHLPQSLFGAEEVETRFLHVHLNDTTTQLRSRLQQSQRERKPSGALTTSSSISVCSLKALGPDWKPGRRRRRSRRRSRRRRRRKRIIIRRRSRSRRRERMRKKMVLNDDVFQPAGGDSVLRLCTHLVVNGDL